MCEPGQITYVLCAPVFLFFFVLFVSCGGHGSAHIYVLGV